jgi:Zinc knuckle
LDVHTRIVHMMPQNTATNNDTQPWKNHGSKDFGYGIVTSFRACKNCGEIGHTSKECYERCPHCDASHPNEECPTTQISCYLCEGTDHVPVQCHLYLLVQRMNQRAKDDMIQSIGRIHEDTMPKMSVDTEVKSQKTAYLSTTKCCYICGEEGHISNNCTTKRERFPTYVVEFGDQKFEDLLAREKPKKRKKSNKSNTKVHGQVICRTCHQPGHFANECSENRMNEAKERDEQRSNLKEVISPDECHECHKIGHFSWDCPGRRKNNRFATGYHVANKEHRKDIKLVTCFECKEKGHYANECPENKNVSFKKKDPSLVTCFKCGNKGHYANKCPERNNLMTAYRQPTDLDN